MKIKAVLFDLDGTLLPMDQNVFLKAYFGGLAKRLAPLGYDPKKIIESIWQGSAAMVENNGEKTNEEVFWNRFSEIYGKDAREDEPYFEAYYREDFDAVKSVCGYNPDAVRAVKSIKSLGLRVALATNPLFPRIATEKRIKWAGVDVLDFELVTTYENSCFCKPNPKYYKNILERMNLLPYETLMVGNDVSDDMIARTLGMRGFLITDNLINKENEDISNYPNGSFDKLMEYIKSII